VGHIVCKIDCAEHEVQATPAPDTPDIDFLQRDDDLKNSHSAQSARLSMIFYENRRALFEDVYEIFHERSA
jgi:hypothetical protein